jgi:hypothetical protein
MEAPGAVYRHSVTVYQEMERQSNLVEVEGSKMLVYEGKLVELVTDTCGLSIPYYTKVTQALKGMSCARQIRRGGGGSASLWELLQEPTQELYQAYQSAGVAEEEEEFAPLQMVFDLNTRLKAIEKAIGLRT